MPAVCVCVPTHVHAKSARTFSSEVKSPGGVRTCSHSAFKEASHSSSWQASICLYFYSPGTAVAPNLCPFLHGGGVAYKFGCGHGERQVHKSGISLQALKWSSSSPAYFLLKHRTGFAARELETISGAHLALKVWY